MVPERGNSALVILPDLDRRRGSRYVAHSVSNGAIRVAVPVKQHAGTMRQPGHALGGAQFGKRLRIGNRHVRTIGHDDRMIRGDPIEFGFGRQALFDEFVLACRNAGHVNPLSWRRGFYPFSDRLQGLLHGLGSGKPGIDPLVLDPDCLHRMRMTIHEAGRDELVGQVDDFGARTRRCPDFLIGANGNEFFVLDRDGTRARLLIIQRLEPTIDEDRIGLDPGLSLGAEHDE